MHHFIKRTCADIKPLNKDWIIAAQNKQRTLTKPQGSLGRLEEIGNNLAAIFETETPKITKKRLYVIAGDHGVTEENVSAYPSEVTAQMVENFLKGGAAINVLANLGGIELTIVDAGVNVELSQHHNLINNKIVYGTENFTLRPALSFENTEKSIIHGINLAVTAKQDAIDLLGVGEMGIGNTTSASAITAALMKRPAADVTGRGTGLSESQLKHKVKVIESALEIHKLDEPDPMHILANFGGAEIGMMTGLILGAASKQIPIVIDGFIATSAAALAFAICPRIKEFIFLGHLSPEAGHIALIRYIGNKPILDLDMRLGEGTGAALAMHIMVASSKILTEMATFDEARVSHL